MKKILFSVVLALMALTTINAQQLSVVPFEGDGTYVSTAKSGTTQFSYCTDAIENGVGTGGTNTLSAAITFSASYLSGYVGCEITELAIGLNEGGAFSAATVWIAATKDGAHLAEQSFTAVAGWNEIELTTPYTITGTTDLWFGYTLTVTGTAGCYPIGLSNTATNPNAEHLAIGTDWTTLSANDLSGNLCIIATAEGEFESYFDLSATSFETHPLTVIGEDKDITVEITHAGNAIPDTFNLYYSIDGGAEVAATFTEGLVMNGTALITHPTPFVATEAGNPTVTVRVEATDETQADNNEVEGTLIAVTEEDMPVRNGILVEVFTTMRCRFCPNGAAALRAAIAGMDDPTKAVWMSHHVGYYTDFLTVDESEDYLSFFGFNSAPNCMVGRKDIGEGLVFSPYDATTPMLEGLLNSPTMANVSIEKEYDEATRTLTVTVSGTALVSELNVNLLLTQNKIMAEQAGATGLYEHNNNIRLFETGSWGETVTVTDNTYEATYTITIPEAYNDVPVLLPNIDIVAFVANHDASNSNNCEVYDALKVALLPTPEVGAMLANVIANPATDCSNEMSFTATVNNWGSSDITSMEIEYGVEGETAETFSWTGTLAPGASVDIALPAVEIAIGVDVTVEAVVTTANDVTMDLYPMSTVVNKDVYTTGGWHMLTLKTDNYGSETTFELTGPSGQVVLEGGPFTDQSVVRTYAFAPAEIGCYVLTVFDAYGDGMNTGYGQGNIKLTDATNAVVFDHDGTFTESVSFYMNIDEVSAVEDFTAETVNVYPNPAKDQINISAGQNISNITVVNMMGQIVSNENVNNTFHTVNVSNLANGIYFVKATINTQVVTQKVIVQ